MVAKSTIMTMTMIMMATTMMMVAMSKAERVWLRWRRTREPGASILLFGSCHLRLFFSSTNYFQIVRQGRESRRETSIIQCLPRPCKSFAALHWSSGFFSVAMFFFIFPNFHKRHSEGKPCHPLIKHFKQFWVTSATKTKDFFGSKKGKRRNVVSLLTTLFLVWYSFVLQSKL